MNRWREIVADRPGVCRPVSAQTQVAVLVSQPRVVLTKTRLRRPTFGVRSRSYRFSYELKAPRKLDSSRMTNSRVASIGLATSAWCWTIGCRVCVSASIESGSCAAALQRSHLVARLLQQEASTNALKAAVAQRVAPDYFCDNFELREFQ